MNKRLENNVVKKDPLDELGEVYVEVQIIEQDFQKALEMCQALIKNGREHFENKSDI